MAWAPPPARPGSEATTASGPSATNLSAARLGPRAPASAHQATTTAL